MARLTEDKIRKLRWDSAKRTKAGNVPKFQPHNDSEVGGLHIRLYAPKLNGQSSKTFYVQYGADVDRKAFKIGSWGEWTLEDARDKARKIRRDFFEHGIDPNQAKRKKIQQAGTKPTVKELVEKYLAAHPSPAVWAESYARDLRVLSNNLTAVEHGMLAEDLTKEELGGATDWSRVAAGAQYLRYLSLVHQARGAARARCRLVSDERGQDEPHHSRTMSIVSNTARIENQNAVRLGSTVSWLPASGPSIALPPKFQRLDVSPSTQAPSSQAKVCGIPSTAGAKTAPAGPSSELKITTS